MDSARAATWIRAYYLATPAFALADLAAGLNIRITALHSPGARIAYYALCVGCALAIHALPRFRASIALGESSLNLLLLAIAGMAPSLLAIETLLGNPHADLQPFVFGPLQVANTAIAGGALYLAFTGAVRELAGGAVADTTRTTTRTRHHS
jgi:hypothetical protein